MAKTATEELTEAGRLARNKYQRDYRRKHPEKVRAYYNRHYNKMGARLAKAAVSDMTDDVNEGD